MIESLHDLPAAFKDYIVAMVNGRAGRWVTEPVPALLGRSILDLANEQGLSATRDFLNDVGSRIGMPYEIGAGYDQAGQDAAE